MKVFVCSVILLLIGLSASAAEHRCANDAKFQGKKLLALHTDNDIRREIGDTTQTLAPLRNPSNAKQKFDVIEVTGYVYKATYRMHMIYVLVGQEILEMTSL